MANELDELMDKDPLGLSDEDLDNIIKYLRQQRLAAASGVSPKKAAKTGMVSLDSLVSELTLTPKAEPEKRRA